MLHLLGLNHKTAPVEVRERFAVPAPRLGHALGYVLGVPGIREATIVSTCNRVEIYAWGDEKAGPRLRDSMIDYHPFGAPRGLENHLHYSRGEDAVQHLFEVASGLDSLVLGENEILGQIKVAIEAARIESAAGAHLDELFRRAIGCGKRARSETGISRGALSVGAAGVELAKQIFGSLQGHTVLILGAGKMSGRVAQCLVSSGAHRVLVANRTLERAQELAREFNDEGAGAEAVGWEDFPEKLALADIVIASTRAPHYVVTREQVVAASKKRRRSLLLIDIAVPRDIDPACNELSDVFLFDIDDLQNVVEEGRKSRASEIVRVEAIIGEEMVAWNRYLKAADAQPVMAALAKRAALIRDNELESALSKLEHLDPRDRATVEALARSIAGKMVHAPLAHLRQGGAGDAPALGRAFGLNVSNGDEENA
ncbi:MAG TPA: glutamyl-tRNA reductase [Abditibacterium sp.]|jgi:glutamyl-tRNA reductase